MSRRVLVFFAALLLQLLAANGADSTAINTLPGCQAECGNVSIPYPFGVGTDGNGKDCFGQPDFEITCNVTTTTPEAYLARSNKVVVTSMSVLYGEVRVLSYMGVDCDYPDGRRLNGFGLMDLSGLAFTFSASRNKFTVLGCDTEAFIGGKRGVLYTGGCISYCGNISGVANGTCSGLGCCQTPIPKGLRMYNATVRSFNDHRNGWNVGQYCGYAFLVAEDQYQFQIRDLYVSNFWQRRFPVVLDWSMGNSSCGPQLEQSQEYACRSKNSECVNSTRGVGYVCNCTTGYAGNPYLENGCQDINECDHPAVYPCDGRCKNTIGGYKCSTGQLKRVLVGAGVGLGILFFLLICFFAIWGLQRRKLRRMMQVIKTYEDSILRLYSEEELDRATQKVSPNERILDEGSQGTVYKGVLEGNQVVAIKQFNKLDERRRKEFVKEIITLSQINHENVVKLLGCCLGVEQPVLVYEFIPGGNLSSFIHERDRRGPISLDARLSIAIGIADALTYLHSYDPTPIFHGDIQSSNILLDENKTAKLSEFTASRLALKDKKQLATMVQGTYGYLDPEYFQTNQLTEKSDVYSFGVVLVELLTGKDPLVFEGPEEQRSLALHFVSSVTQNRLMEILDGEIVSQMDEERLRGFADIACQCLKTKGEDRPTMVQVLTALTAIGEVPRAPVGSL